ncbi:PTS transporter subunit EIIC [Olsenella intestinalis]|uniref:PTS transporter subunit EIIC n=1 Tax=Olsenella intestinalis TaxID=2930083 RepID=UPI00200F74C8|nr:PTS transporter subunit EIIC [Olsenella intestinalis]
MAKDYSELADQVVELVGGAENVTYFTHCITRLRFNLKDKNLAEVDALADLPGTIGALWSGDQLQVIIGPAVGNVYDTIVERSGIESRPAVEEEEADAPAEDEKKGFSINNLFATLSACIVPIIPAMCGAGIIKGTLLALSSCGVLATDTGIYTVLSAISDAPFYFLPVLAAIGASKKFNVDQVLGAVIGCLFIHPTIVALAGTDISVLGLPMHILNYSSTVFPVVISIWIMSKVYRFVDKFVPDVLKIILTPSITLLVMTLVCLGVVGPLGYYFGLVLAQVIQTVFDFAPALGGAILGAIRPFVIFTGMQSVFTPIMMNNLAVLGYDYLSSVHTAATMAAAGMCLGAFLRTKDRDSKESYFSFFVSAFIGITEPALYGLAFRFRKQLIALCAGGAAGGAVASVLDVRLYAPAMPSWISFPAFGDTGVKMLISVAVALVVTVAVSYILGFDDAEQKQ